MPEKQQTINSWLTLLWSVRHRNDRKMEMGNRVVKSGVWLENREGILSDEEWSSSFCVIEIWFKMFNKHRFEESKILILSTSADNAEIIGKNRMFAGLGVGSYAGEGRVWERTPSAERDTFVLRNAIMQDSCSRSHIRGHTVLTFTFIFVYHIWAQSSRKSFFDRKQRSDGTFVRENNFDVNLGEVGSKNRKQLVPYDVARMAKER